MRVLVTGASGFLAQRLMKVLRAQGHEPLATTRNRGAAGSNVYLLEDALDADSYSRLIEEQEVEAVVNTLAAGVDPSDRDIAQLLHANTLFPAQLAANAKAAGARVFIQIGSSAEYAPVAKSTGLNEDDTLTRDRLYGATKAAGSIALQAVAGEVGLGWATLRLFNVFGPGEKPYRLFPSLVGRLARGEAVPLSAGTQMRDFLFVDDACRAIAKILETLDRDHTISGTYNLASGEGVSVGDFARAIAAEMRVAPQLLKFGELPMRPDDLPYVVADTGRLDALIGPASHTALRDAIARTLIETNRCESE